MWPEETARAPFQTELVENLKITLAEQGFKHLRVTAGKSRIAISGKLHSDKDLNVVRDLARALCPPELLDFDGLKLQRPIAKMARPKRPPQESEPEPPRVEPAPRQDGATPKPPPAPPEGVRFKFGQPTVTRIR